MAKLDQLIRVKKWNLDVARRELVELETMRSDLRKQIARIEAGLVEEQMVATKGGWLGNYGEYADAQLARRKRLNDTMSVLDKQIAEKLDQIQLGFEELKTVQIASDRAAEKQAYKQLRAQQITLDDIAGQRAFRSSR